MLKLTYPALRTLTAITLASLVACGAHDARDDEEVTDQDSTAVVDDGYVGDQGPGWDTPEYDPTTAPDFSLESIVDDPILHEAPERVVLDFTWQGQPNGYWCGPGSTRMALSTRFPASELPSQTVLADALGTTREGTVRAELIRVLNEYIVPHTPYVSVPMDGRPTEEQRALLKYNLVRRLSSGLPVVANVLSGWRPPGYPTGTIGHFVAVMGYEDRGEKVLIADPAAEGSAGPHWVNVPRTYWISVQDLGTWIGARGYSGGY